MGRAQRSDSIVLNNPPAAAVAQNASSSYNTNNINVVTYKAGERTSGMVVNNANTNNGRKIGSIIDYDPLSQETVYTNPKNVNSGSIKIMHSERPYSNGSDAYTNGSTVKIVNNGFNNNHESVANKNYCDSVDSETIIPRQPPNTVS